MKKKTIQIINNTGSKIVKKTVEDQLTVFKNKYKYAIESLSISFINDKDMIELNNKYLAHSGSTDIITFDYGSDDNIIDGEILICVDEAKRQSKTYKVRLRNEIARLVFHGLLHLTGQKDKTKKEKEEMTDKENELLNIWERKQ